MAQRFGRDIGELSPGLKVLPAFYRIAYIVSKQSCTYDAPVFHCPTSDDVRVSVDVVLVFAVNDPSKFVYRLGAKNFDDFLSGTVDEAIRMLVRKEDHRSVYDLRGERADIVLKLLNDKFLESGVRFSDVKITDVILPATLAECLETTTKLNKAMERLKRQNEYEMMEIKLESEMAIEEIRRKTEQVLVVESGAKRRAELEFEQKSVRAEEDGRVSLIDAEGQAEVNLLKAKAELDRRRKEMEKFQVEQIVAASVDATEVMLQADMHEETEVIGAEARREEMVNEAMGIKHECATERMADKMLAASRRHQVDLREKTIIGELAENGNFNLVGTSGDKIVESMMSGRFQPPRRF